MIKNWKKNLLFGTTHKVNIRNKDSDILRNLRFHSVETWLRNSTKNNAVIVSCHDYSLIHGSYDQFGISISVDFWVSHTFYLFDVVWFPYSKNLTDGEIFYTASRVRKTVFSVSAHDEKLFEKTNLFLWIHNRQNSLKMSLKMSIRIWPKSQILVKSSSKPSKHKIPIIGSVDMEESYFDPLSKTFVSWSTLIWLSESK